MDRLLVSWAGPQVVGAAVNVLHFNGVNPPVAADVKAAYDFLHPWLPLGVSISIPDSGDIITATTGTLEGAWSSSGGPATTNASGSDKAAAGVGACVTWNTGDIVGGRRLRGRTFIVPLSTVAYDSQGTLAPDAITALNQFADELIGLDLVVWHRPTTVGGSDGSFAAATTRKVSDRVATLRSRRF